MGVPVTSTLPGRATEVTRAATLTGWPYQSPPRPTGPRAGDAGAELGEVLALVVGGARARASRRRAARLGRHEHRRVADRLDEPDRRFAMSAAMPASRPPPPRRPGAKLSPSFVNPTRSAKPTFTSSAPGISPETICARLTTSLRTSSRRCSLEHVFELLAHDRPSSRAAPAKRIPMSCSLPPLPSSDVAVSSATARATRSMLSPITRPHVGDPLRGRARSRGSPSAASRPRRPSSPNAFSSVRDLRQPEPPSHVAQGLERDAAALREVRDGEVAVTAELALHRGAASGGPRARRCAARRPRHPRREAGRAARVAPQPSSPSRPSSSPSDSQSTGYSPRSRSRKSASVTSAGSVVSMKFSRISTKRAGRRDGGSGRPP